MRGKTVIIDRKKFNEAIQAYCKRNGVGKQTVLDAHGLSGKYDSNGRMTFQRKHPDSKLDALEVLCGTYDDLCRAFLLSPTNYVIEDLQEGEEEVAKVADQNVNAKTATVYLRMLNERLMDIEKLQSEQNELLKRLLTAWEK